MQRLALALLALLPAFAGCQSIASITRLPEDVAREDGYDDEDVRLGRLPAEELAVVPLELEGIHGAAIAFVLDGPPDEVLAMLLDFEGATGRREWCETYETVSIGEDSAEAVWHFKRYKIFKPVVTLLYSIHEEDAGEQIVVEFRAKAPAPGVAALFGQYRLHALPHEEGAPPETLMRSRIFIDTGFAIGVSAEDLADGLRKDARALRAWLAERLALQGADAGSSPGR